MERSSYILFPRTLSVSQVRKPHSTLHYIKQHSSPQISETCGEHKLSVMDDKKDQRMKQMQRAQWLRAAILGANDGLLSTTALMLGVGAAKEDQSSMVLSGLAGAVAGACSMAAGEFVSVSTQRDIEQAAIKEREATKERSSKANLDGDDHIKLEITPAKGILSVSPALTPLRITTPCRDTFDSDPAQDKAVSYMSPARSPVMKVIITDERRKGLQGPEEEDSGEEVLPNPYKAAVASAVSFLLGSLVPLVSAMLVSNNTARIAVIVAVTTIALALFGATGARLGGSPIRASAARVLVGGWISMAITYGLLKPFDKD